MGKHSNNQSGFSPVEGLLILIVLVVLGSISYFVWHNHSPKTATKTNSKIQSSILPKTTKTATPAPPAAANKVQPVTLKLLSGVQSTAAPLTYSRDTASAIDNIVRFSQPDSWRDDADTTAQGCGIAGCLGQTLIVPGDEDENGATTPDYFVVTVSAFQTGSDAKSIFANNWQDSNGAAASAYSAFTTTDGVNGFKYDFEPTTPTAANGNKYLEHVAYGISNGSYAAILDVSYFNGNHASFTNKTNTDYGQYAASVEQIAKTLHLGS